MWSSGGTGSGSNSITVVTGSHSMYVNRFGVFINVDNGLSTSTFRLV